MSKPLILIPEEDQHVVLKKLLHCLDDEVLYQTKQISRKDLTDHSIFISNNRVFFDGQHVTALIMLTPFSNDFSSSYQQDDRSFVDIEFKALILSMLHSDLFVVNRYTSSAWFEGSSWSYWRTQLIKHRIPVSPFKFGFTSPGGHWIPYLQFVNAEIPSPEVLRYWGIASTYAGSADTTYVCFDETIGDLNHHNVSTAISLLQSHGINYGAVTTDDQHNILQIHTAPVIEDEKIAIRIAQQIKNKFHEYLYGRRHAGSDPGVSSLADAATEYQRD